MIHRNYRADLPAGLWAIHLYTMGSAYAEFMEHQKGSLSKGKVADMAVLSNDILSISPDKIKDVKVIMTIVGGMIVYRNDVL